MVDRIFPFFRRQWKRGFLFFLSLFGFLPCEIASLVYNVQNTLQRIIHHFLRVVLSSGLSEMALNTLLSWE